MNVAYVLVKYQKINKRASTGAELGWVVRMKTVTRCV